MRQKVILAVFVLLLTAAVRLHAKPNVIFILTDDLGYGDVGWTFQNSRPVASQLKIHTPVLDRLAGEGVTLPQHYCAAPVCAPSRASILTGVRQDKCSVRNNMFDHPLKEPETLGSVMRRAGYRTMAIGKWGVAGGGESGQPVSAHPLDKGFDSYYGFLDHLAGHTYYHYDGFMNGAYMGIWENRTKVTGSAEGIYSTDLFVARAKRDIAEAVREDPERPFFLYLAVNTIHGSGRSDHTLPNKHALHVPGREYPAQGVSWPLSPEPLEARNTWIDPLYRACPDENMQRYATAITRLDTALADLMDYLAQLGIDKNTIIIFTSDNGPADEYGADTRAFGSTGPFDGLKRDVYEGGMRVPTFVWRQGGFPVKSDSTPSISTDWMATLADLAGVPVPEQCDGVSLLPRFEGREAQPSVISTRYHGYGSNQADFKEFAERKHHLVRGEQTMSREGDIVTLQAGGKDRPVRRYNVVEDPHQDRDLNGN